MVGFIAWAILSGCGSKNKIKAEDVVFENHPELPGVATVSWTAKRTGQAHIEYGLSPDNLDMSTPVVTVDSEEGEITVLGLKTTETYYFKVVIDDEGNIAESEEPIEGLVQPPPQGTASLTLEQWNPELACPDEGGGYILLNYLGDHESGVAIVDRDADYVWSVRSQDRNVQFARTRLGRDGRSILWNTNDYDRIDDIATVERLSIDGSSSSTTRTLNGHHDFIEFPEGGFAWIGYAFAGPPLDILSEEFPEGWSVFPTAYDVIYRADEGITDAVAPTLVFDQLRDWPEGFYYNDRTERCDQFLPGYCEMGHGNSLAYIDSTSEFQLGMRWLDVTLRIDGAGAVQWVFGGPLNELAGPEEDLPVHHHYSDVWEDGMMIFDNHDPAPSRLMEYSFDFGAMTFTNTWKAQLDENEGLLGDMRRIPLEGCDNILVALSQQGILEERTREGEIVWRAFYGKPGTAIGRLQYLSSLYDFADQANWQ